MSEHETAKAIELNPASLKALVHPLRIGMLGILRADGPEKDTQLSSASITDDGELNLVQTATTETSGAHTNAISITDSGDEVYFSVTAYTEDSKNLGVGPFTGPSMTTGTANMMFGYAAGNALTEGADNALIGRKPCFPVHASA